MFSLKTQDILGATASSKGLGVFAEVHQRRGVRGINKTDDIDGAQAGSLKRGTNTKRFTNPLDPNYQLLGHTELVDPSNAFSRPREEHLTKSSSFSKATSVQQKTAIETLKKPLEVIHEKTA